MDLEGDGWGHGGSGHYYLLTPGLPAPLEIFFRSAREINPIKIIIHVFEYSLQKITLVAIIRP